MQETKRRKRFARSDEERAGTRRFEYTPCCARILEELARFRWLRSSHIEMLLHGEYSKSTVDKSLRKLYGWQFVERLDIFRTAYTSWNDRLIYAITPVGRRKLLTHPTPYMAVKGSEDGTRHSFLGHTLMTADGMSNLIAGTKVARLPVLSMGDIIEKSMARRNDPKREKYQNPLSMPSRFSYTFPETGRHEQYNAHVTPDTVMNVTYPGNVSRLFLIEFEHESKAYRRTLKSSSTFRKVLAYNAITKEDIRYYYGKSNFYVLIICASEVEMKNAIAKATEALGSSDRFLFRYMETQESLMKNPKPHPEMFAGEWQRIGLPPIRLTDLGV